MKYIIANWKMNPASYQEAQKLFRAVSTVVKRKKNVEVVLCVPFPYLSNLGPRTSNLSLGAQDCFWESPVGPYTGEVSPAMLKNSGVEYVILGHSERRKFSGETDEVVAKKVKAALEVGLKVVLCVGEPLAVRKKGFAASKRFVAGQLKKDLALASRIKHQASSIFVAYEPVWAISTSGTGLPCSAEDANAMIPYIRTLLASGFQLRASGVIYGGSVNEKNAKGFLAYESIDGVLPGAASLDMKKFSKIIEAAEEE